MRLLVTRPEPDASETAGRLRELGHAVLVEPMMRIEFSPEPAGLAAPAAILLTSGNAVRALERWPSAAAWRRFPVFVIGRATAAQARNIGFTDVRTADRDAATLADLVRAEFDKAAGQILYPAARDRSADMAAMLAGFMVETVEAYRGIAATSLDEAVASAIASARIDGVLFFSRRTAAIFADLVKAAGVGAGLRRAVLFALSAAVAEPLARLQPATIRVAAQPDEESLLALIPPPA